METIIDGLISAVENAISSDQLSLSACFDLALSQLTVYCSHRNDWTIPRGSHAETALLDSIDRLLSVTTDKPWTLCFQYAWLLQQSREQLQQDTFTYILWSKIFTTLQRCQCVHQQEALQAAIIPLVIRNLLLSQNSSSSCQIKVVKEIMIYIHLIIAPSFVYIHAQYKNDEAFNQLVFWLGCLRELFNNQIPLPLESFDGILNDCLEFLVLSYSYRGLIAKSLLFPLLCYYHSYVMNIDTRMASDSRLYYKDIVDFIWSSCQSILSNYPKDVHNEILSAVSHILCILITSADFEEIVEKEEGNGTEKCVEQTVVEYKRKKRNKRVVSSTIETKTELVNNQRPSLALQHLSEIAGFWELICQWMSSDQLVIRKRGAYVLSRVKGSLGREPSWVSIYLDAYHQIEGCGSTHLMSQVFPHISYLFLHSSSSSSFFNSPTLRWTVALLRCLLTSQIASIRRLGLYKLLSGDWVLPEVTTEVIDWICYDLIPLIDDTVFFSSRFVAAGDVDSLLRIKETQELTSANSPSSVLQQLNQQQQLKFETNSPGSLFPSFFAWLLCAAPSDELRVDFIQKLIVSICGEQQLRSYSAVKWILRTFADSHTCFSIAAIGVVQLNHMKSFYHLVVVSSNLAIRGQLLSGFLGLLLQTIDCHATMLTDLFAFLDNEISWDVLLATREHCDLIVDILCHYLQRQQQFDQLQMHHPRLLGSFLVILTSQSHLLCDLSEVHAFVAMIHDRMILQLANIVYSNPYSISKDNQCNISSFFEGVNHLHRLIYLKSCRSSWSGDLALSNILDCQSIVSFFEVSIIHIVGFYLNAQSVDILSNQSTLPASIQQLEQFFCFVQGLSGLLYLPLLKSDQRRIILQAIVNILSFLLESLQVSRDNDRPYLYISFYLGLKSIGDMLVAIVETNSAPDLSPAFTRLVMTQFCPQLIHLKSDMIVYSPAISHDRFLFTAMNNLFPYPSKWVSHCQEYKWKAIERLLVVGLQPSNNSVFAVELFESILEEIEAAGLDAVADMLSATLLVLQALKPSDVHLEVDEAVDTILSTAWRVIHSSSQQSIHTVAMNKFIKLTFDKTVLRLLDNQIIQDYFNDIYDGNFSNRPHIIQYMISTLCVQFHSYHILSIPFFPSFPRLLLYREPRTEEQLICGGSPSLMKEDITSDKSFCRILILSYLESLATASSLSAVIFEAAEQLAITLFNNSLSSRYNNAIVGSALFGEQLRAWQALCILAPMLPETFLTPILDTFLSEVLYQTCSPGIRVHFEVFGSILLIRFPTLVLPRMLAILRVQFNIVQQTLASYMVMLGHVILSDASSLSMGQKMEVAEVLVPWLVCGSSLPRAIAQLVMYLILPEIMLHLQPRQQQQQQQLSQWSGIFLFLSENKETVKMIQRQKAFFTSYQLDKLCTVKGLLTIVQADPSSGEIIPEHLLTVLSDYFKETSNIVTEPRKPDEESCLLLSRDLQTKIVIPWNELSLNAVRGGGGGEGGKASRSSSARHPLVVCASLIEKPINLAGIARTSEIFAVQSLIIASKQITRTEEFKGVAVSSSEWLPMEEVSEERLPMYLSTMKAQGYTLIGIEQTGSSHCLSEVSFPAKSLFLLGKEKEGIPVKLLQLMDFCVEIPQFGIIRSLNVHVSASIAIWEYCKQQL